MATKIVKFGKAVEEEEPKQATTPEYEEPDWTVKHPNLYGAFGVASSMVPYTKYVDPSERKRFNELSTKKQTRELLFETLKTEVELAGGKVVGAVGKKAIPLAGKFLQKNLPKTYKFLTKSLSKSKPIEFSKPSGAVEDIKVPPEKVGIGTEPLPHEDVLRMDEMREISGRMKDAIDDPQKAFISDPKRRIMYDVYETIQEHPEYTRKILEQYNITPQELADDFIKAGSHAGKTLNQLSQIRKNLLNVLGDDPAIAKLKNVDVPESWAIKAGNIWSKIDRPRRMMMVAQMATAARNAVSQAGYYSLRIVEDALKGTFKTIGGKETPKEAFTEFAQDIGAIVRRLQPSKRKALQKILDQDVKIQSELLSAPIHDISLGGKASKVIMFFNRIQENVFRKMAFDARVTALAKKKGYDLDNITPEIADKFRKDVLEPSMNNALEITFAKTPKLQLPGNVTAKQLIDFWSKFPGLTTIQPFPRFWANSIKFLWDFNPTGFITAAQRAIINKGGKSSYEAMARATAGTMMLGMGLHIRNSEYAGEKWYEVKTGRKNAKGQEEQIDLRGFAPFSSYLYLAEAALQSVGGKPNTLSGYDAAQALIGINRIAGTGLVLIDALRASSGESALKMAKNFLGQYLGGYTVGVKSASDFLTLINPREAKTPSTRENPIAGPLMSNLPRETIESIGYELPEAQRITRGETYERGKPVTRQLTGFTFKYKTPLEKEIDRIGITRLYPKTGDATFDRKVTDHINENVEKYLGELIETERYKESSIKGKESLLRDRLSKIKKGVEGRIGVEHYSEKISKIKTNANKIKLVKYLAKKERLSKSALKTLIAQNRIRLSRQDIKDIMEEYK